MYIWKNVYMRIYEINFKIMIRSNSHKNEIRTRSEGMSCVSYGKFKKYEFKQPGCI